MTITDTVTAAIPNRIAQFPDLKLLPAKARPIVTEYLEVYARLDGLAKTYADLTSAESIRTANEIDAGAQANAIRQGQTASSVGSPAADDLKARTLAAEQELVGAITAVNTITAEVRAVLADLWADDKNSGRDAAAAAVQAYRDAIAAVSDARHAAHAALILPMFIEGVAHHPSPDGPRPWNAPNVNAPTNDVWLNPSDRIDIPLLSSLLDKDADAFADALPLP